jgi:hypothetical protein
MESTTPFWDYSGEHDGKLEEKTPIKTDIYPVESKKKKYQQPSLQINNHTHLSRLITLQLQTLSS